MLSCMLEMHGALTGMLSCGPLSDGHASLSPLSSDLSAIWNVHGVLEHMHAAQGKPNGGSMRWEWCRRPTSRESWGRSTM